MGPEHADLPTWAQLIVACEGGWGYPGDIAHKPGSALWAARRAYLMPFLEAKRMKDLFGHGR